MQEVNNTSALEEQLYYIGECKKFLEKKTKEIGRPLYACVHTFGCQMNARDSEKLLGVLKEIISQMTKLHQFAIMCAPTNSQFAAIEALKNCDMEVNKMVEAYDQRRRYLMHAFKEMGLDCFEPFGAFYVFPSIKKFGLSSEEFANRLLREQKLAVVPGTAFGDCGEGFLRISYAYSIDNLKQGLERIEKFINTLK